MVTPEGLRSQRVLDSEWSGVFIEGGRFQRALRQPRRMTRKPR